MKSLRPHPWWQWLLAGLALASMITAAVVLYLFDPSTAGFYPVCPLHQTTGLDCPGCGSLRAMHALVHGRFLEAWRFNALFILILPCASWLGLREAVRWCTGRTLPGIIAHPAFAWVAAIAVIVWGVARNVPFLRHSF